ncbi:MAG: hypothetical protein RLZZ126_658 [Pseudomonadota bacterium]
MASGGIGRRRLLRAGLAATPVVLAVGGRSAMAKSGDACVKGLSPMAWNSLTANGTKTCLQTSHTVQGNTFGLSPGYWRPNGPSNNGYQMGTSPSWPINCLPYSSYSQGTQWAPTSTDWTSGKRFNQVFIGATDTRTLSEILIAGNENTSANWHLCAAYLNALTMPDYAMTVAEVLALGSGTLGTQTGLTASEIKSYLNQTWN